MKAREALLLLWTSSVTIWKRSCRSSAKVGATRPHFDNVLEFLVMAGRSLPHALLRTIVRSRGQKRREHQPGAAGVVRGPLVADGAVARSGVDRLHGRPPDWRRALHRNGLRPSRYYVTKDDLIVLASEVGVLDIRAADVIVRRSGCTWAGMFLVDTEQGALSATTRSRTSSRPIRTPSWLKHLIPIRIGAAGAGPARAGRRNRAAGGSRRSATPVKTCGSCWSRWRETARSRSGRWAPTHRWRSSPISRA